MSEGWNHRRSRSDLRDLYKPIECPRRNNQLRQHNDSDTVQHSTAQHCKTLIHFQSSINHLSIETNVSLPNQSINMVRVQNIVVFALAQLIIAAPPAEPTTTTIGTFDAGKCKTHTLYCGHTLKRLGTLRSCIYPAQIADQNPLLYRLEHRFDSEQSCSERLERRPRSPSRTGGPVFVQVWHSRRRPGLG